MRRTVIALLLTFASALPAAAGNLSVTIGFDVPVAAPTLQRIPNYPVYYAPAVRTNYFFHDGLYWVFDGGDWYSSVTYSGPWEEVDRYEVPVALLQVPVRYYRSKPVSFRSYRVDAAPHWHEHWGHRWAERRTDWMHRHEPRHSAERGFHRERQAPAYTYSAPAERPREAWGPPAHAPAYGYRAKEQRERDKQEWKRVKEQRKWEREREKEAREWARERAREEREWRHERREDRYERVAQRRHRDDD